MAEGQFTVLLVEDEPLIALTFVEAIEELGHQAVAAHSGAQALALFHAQPRVDLLITDLGLSDCSGFELVDRIRAIAPSLPVIIASGQSLPSIDAASDPLTLAIAKPFQLGQLQEAITRLLS